MGSRLSAATNILAAEVGDLESLLEIENAAFSSAKYEKLSRRQMLRHLRSGKTVFLVARNLAGTVQGYALGFTSKNSTYLRFYSLAVHPDAQGGRLGAQLFAAIEAAASDLGKDGVQCEIRADNETLLTRYTKLGYLPYKRVPDYYPDGEACIKMKRAFHAGSFAG